MEKKRIVVIGNHWETQMMATCALEGAGYDTITLFDKRHAIRAVREVKPDLVLLDMALPKLKAWQIARSIRQDTSTHHVPIIGIVPKGANGEIAQIRRRGLINVFSKSIDNHAFIRKVRRVLKDEGEYGTQ